MTVEYDIGDRPTLTFTFRDLDGDLADPTAITFRLLDPDGNETTEDETDATNTTTGVWVWELPQTFDESGRWFARAEGTETVIAAVETQIPVRPSRFD